jgi:uncharacterized membrane protein YdjX (TVP38/TMEM64 family)
MLDQISTLIENSGALMYVLAPLFMIGVAIVPIPAEMPAAMNGMIFGPVIGAVVTWGGAMVGAMVSFEIARRFGRPVAARVLSPRALDTTDRLVRSAGWSGLLAARLIPTVAFTALNWGLGLSDVRRSTFFWTTAVGILPGAVAFTAFGSGLGALYREHPIAAIALGVLLLLVIGVTVVRYLRNRNEDESGRAGTPATP